MTELVAPIRDCQIDIDGVVSAFKVLDLTSLTAPVSGNKYFKLHDLNERLGAGDFAGVVSYGGPYSNHLLALAKLGAAEGFDTIGFVRGRYFNTNPVLQLCESFGMRIKPLASSTFSDYEALEDQVRQSCPEHLFLPMGGSDQRGIEAVALLLQLIPESVASVHLPVGSGGSIAGLAKAHPEMRLVGYQVVGDDSWKDLDSVATVIRKHGSNIVWKSRKDGARFGKATAAIVDFAREWFAQTGLKLDLNYNAPALMALSGEGVNDPNVLYVNTGGLEGNLGHEERLGVRIYA